MEAGGAWRHGRELRLQCIFLSHLSYAINVSVDFDVLRYPLSVDGLSTALCVVDVGSVVSVFVGNDLQ